MVVFSGNDANGNRSIGAIRNERVQSNLGYTCMAI